MTFDCTYHCFVFSAIANGDPGEAGISLVESIPGEDPTVGKGAYAAVYTKVSGSV